jgi:hypothetical protein
MSYFVDLSGYSYDDSLGVSTSNVGWLDSGHEFAVGEPSAAFLERLWQFCLVSVYPSRGLHFCPYCDTDFPSVVERAGLQIMLGSAEIRVFSQSGEAAFASPNLIYHYVATHHYLPPLAFVAAVESGPQPFDPQYDQLLVKSGVSWHPTPLQKQEPVVFRYTRRGDEFAIERIAKPKP